jgi:hypothetical protein
MSPPAVQQVISALKVILGEDGSNRGKFIKAPSMHKFENLLSMWPSFKLLS